MASGDPAQSGANRGQIVLMFALFLTAMLGILGLAIDLGFSFAQRRTIQGAADLAATAGARAVARYYDNPAGDDGDQLINALADVEQIVSENHIKGTETKLEGCNYIDSGGLAVGDCSIPVPPNAIGVEVGVSETHRTFFINIVPGAPVYVTTSATATARLERMARAGSDSPFIVCGYDTKLRTPVDGSDEMDILLRPEITVPSGEPDPDDWTPDDWEDVITDDSWSDNDFWDQLGYQVNPSAIGQTFQFTGSTRDSIARCGAGLRWTAFQDPDGDSVEIEAGNPYLWALAERLGRKTATGPDAFEFDDGSPLEYLNDKSASSFWETSGSYGVRLRGVADPKANEGKGVVYTANTYNNSEYSYSPWWNPMLVGTVDGSVPNVASKVHGVEGCQELATKPYNCVILVPIATEYNSTTGVRRFKVTKVLAFDVFRDESNPNIFYGTLLDDYLVFGASIPPVADRAPWCRDCGSVLVIRLVG